MAALMANNLRSAEARGWGRDDDLTNGAWLDKYCPGKNRSSDIDSEPGHHVLHNRHISPHREITIEYKNTDGTVREGQTLMLRDRVGLVTREDGMRIERRVFIITHEGMKLTGAWELHSDGTYPQIEADSADILGHLICNWVWPELLRALPAREPQEVA